MAEIPKVLLTAGVPAPARLTLVALWSYAKARELEPFVWPSAATLALDVRTPERTVWRHLRALRGAGLIQRTTIRDEGRQKTGWTLARTLSPATDPDPGTGDRAARHRLAEPPDIPDGGPPRHQRQGHPVTVSSKTLSPATGGDCHPRQQNPEGNPPGEPQREPQRETLPETLTTEARVGVAERFVTLGLVYGIQEGQEVLCLPPVPPRDRTRIVPGVGGLRELLAGLLVDRELTPRDVAIQVLATVEQIARLMDAGKYDAKWWQPSLLAPRGYGVAVSVIAENAGSSPTAPRKEWAPDEKPELKVDPESERLAEQFLSRRRQSQP